VLAHISRKPFHAFLLGEDVGYLKIFLGDMVRMAIISGPYQGN
jgi:hypothetical protein